MRIVCPQCGYTRDIPPDKVPARISIATCPKCQFRFRFRGPSAAPAVEDAPRRDPGFGADEPVYPPRPSRTVTPREPLEAPPAPPFEPRFPRGGRTLREPEADPGQGARLPSWPQARWLPDPEPGADAGPNPAVERVSRRLGQQPDAAASRGVPGAEGFADEAPPSAAARAARERVFTEADAGAPGAAAQIPVESGPAPGFVPLEPDAPAAAAPAMTFTPVEPAVPAAPLDFPDEQPAPWERMEFSAGAQEQTAAPEAEPARDPFWEQAGPQPGLPEGDGEEQAQPSQAQAGDDSVRDIWARLQAMGTGPKGTQASRQEDGEPKPARAFHADTVAPWEQLEHYGVVPAFLNTARNALFKPGDFFEQMPPVSGKLRPLLFAVAVGVLAVLAGVVWNYFGLGPNLAELGRTDGFQGLGAGAIGGLALLGLSPLALIVFVFVDSSITQVLLGLLRSAARPFEETFRTVCYAGVPWLLAALPMPYSYLIPVVLIWHMTLQAIGLKKLHRAGYPQILASVLVKWSLYFMASFAVLHVLITPR